jgi:hypothetical protein
VAPLAAAGVAWPLDVVGGSSMNMAMSLGLLNSDSRLDPGLEPELRRLEGPLPVPPVMG